MKLLVRWLRSVLTRRQWRRRFPLSVLHPGVAISQDSTGDRYAMLFPGASLLSAHVRDYSYDQANTAIYSAEIGPFCMVSADDVGAAS